jgi:hypothetical protein
MSTFLDEGPSPVQQQQQQQGDEETGEQLLAEDSANNSRRWSEYSRLCILCQRFECLLFVLAIGIFFLVADYLSDQNDDED